MFVVAAGTGTYYYYTPTGNTSRSELYLTNVAANEADIIFSGRVHEWSSIYVNKRRFADAARGGRMRGPLSSIRPS